MNYGNSAGAFRTEGTITHNSALVGTTPWGNSNDGSGSGLDADLLDGLDSTDYRHYTWRSFVVAGDLDKFYPALFSVGNGNHGSSDLEIAQSNVHQNGSGHGAFYARFGVNITGWGHIPQMMTLREYSKTGNTYISKIGDTDHATGQIGIWLRGSTTYYYRSSDGAIFDSVRCTDNQPFLSYDNSNNAYDITISHTTTVDNAIFTNSAHTGKVLNTGNIGEYALPISGGTITGNITAVNGTFTGGVYLGGTGAVNKLEDYEEGTWTPTSTVVTSLGVNFAKYTKIGKQVTVLCQFYGVPNVASTVSWFYDPYRIGGLPFQPNADAVGGVGKCGGQYFYAHNAVARSGTNYIEFYTQGSQNSPSVDNDVYLTSDHFDYGNDGTQVNNSNDHVDVTITYLTDQ
jgi:hypothetical protein